MAALTNPPAGNLPKERTEGSVPYKFIGVDFPGPIKYLSKTKKEMNPHIPTDYRAQDTFTFSGLSHLAKSYITSHCVSHNDWKLLQVLKSLKRNKNIVILKLDKGNGVVILERTAYDNSILTIILWAPKDAQS